MTAFIKHCFTNRMYIVQHQHGCPLVSGQQDIVYTSDHNNARLDNVAVSVGWY